MSLILRHKPEAVGIKLDEYGWVDINVLIEAMNKHGHKIDIDTVNQIVAEDKKGRYGVKDGKIRAVQGHSIVVDLQLVEVAPTSQLYHGTSSSAASIIMVDGIRKMQRHHVHLSVDAATAANVAKRRGSEYVIFSIDAVKMAMDGHKFFRSENGVWLCDYVPPQYIRLVK